MLDSKRHVFGCSGQERAEPAVAKKEKRELGSRSQSRVLSKLYCTKGITKVKENFADKFASGLDRKG